MEICRQNLTFQLIVENDYEDIVSQIKDDTFEGEIKDKFSEEEILKYAIIGEQFSNHPIAKSITRNREIPQDKITIFSSKFLK